MSRTNPKDKGSCHVPGNIRELCPVFKEIDVGLLCHQCTVRQMEEVNQRDLVASQVLRLAQDPLVPCQFLLQSSLVLLDTRFVGLHTTHHLEHTLHSNAKRDRLEVECLDVLCLVVLCESLDVAGGRYELGARLLRHVASDRARLVQDEPVIVLRLTGQQVCIYQGMA